VHGTEVDGVVSAVQRNLKLQVIFLIDVGVGDLTDQLSDVLVSSLGLVNISLQVVLVIDVIRELFER